MNQLFTVIYEAGDRNVFGVPAGKLGATQVQDVAFFHAAAFHKRDTIIAVLETRVPGYDVSFFLSRLGWDIVATDRLIG